MTEQIVAHPSSGAVVFAVAIYLLLLVAPIVLTVLTLAGVTFWAAAGWAWIASVVVFLATLVLPDVIDLMAARRRG